MGNMKPVDSVVGTVIMADGTRRAACKNTYNVTVFSSDGTSARTEQEVRIEFVLYTSAAVGRRYRKTTPKQAATFQAGQ